MKLLFELKFKYFQTIIVLTLFFQTNASKKPNIIVIVADDYGHFTF